MDLKTAFDQARALEMAQKNSESYYIGLQSKGNRQRLLENKTLDLKTAFDQARALEMAQKNSESYYIGIKHFLIFLMH